MSWNDSPHDIDSDKTVSGWQEVQTALRFVLVGYFLLTAGLVFGLVLGRAYAGNLAWVWLRGYFNNDFDDAVLLATGGAALSALLGFILLFAGKLRCLGYVPAPQIARDVMFASVIALVLASLLAIVAGFVGGTHNYRIVLQGASLGERITLNSLEGYLQLAAASLWLVSFLLFNHFLRAVERHFDRERASRGMDLYLLFVSLLVGLSAGAFMHAERLGAGSPVWLGLAASWSLGLLWHVARISSVRRRVTQWLGGTGQPQELPGSVFNPENIPQALSGMRRILRSPH
jgi:hypothetical protein